MGSLFLHSQTLPTLPAKLPFNLCPLPHPPPPFTPPPYLIMPVGQQDHQHLPYPKLHHLVLETTFCGINHPAATPDAQIHQYLGIKYASIPARFRQSKLHHTYPTITDASAHGYVRPRTFSLSSFLFIYSYTPLDHPALSPKNIKPLKKYSLGSIPPMSRARL